MAEVFDCAATVKPISDAGACVTAKVSGTRAGLFGSEPVTVKLPFAPENTETGLTGATAGGSAPLTVTVDVAVEGPKPLLTVSDRLTTVSAVTTGAVYTGLATAGSERLPCAGGPQANVNGLVPVELPANVTVPPELTV